MLRTTEDFEAGYYARVEPLRVRLVFDAWPRRGDHPFMVELECPIPLEPGKPVQITIYVDGSICEVYLDHQVAMSACMYNHPVWNWGLLSPKVLFCYRYSSINSVIGSNQQKGRDLGK